MISVPRNHAFSVLMLIASLVFLTPTSVHAAAVATVEQAQGEVFIHSAGAAADAWAPITDNTPLNNGDSVKTKNGSCAVVYGDQGTFSLSQDTTITVQDKEDTKDILLDLGKLKAKVNKDKMTKPFQVVTPTAVGAVRGTDADFAFNESGQLTVDLHDGNLHVYNDEAGMALNLAGGNKIEINYNADAGILKVKNDCGSAGVVTFSVLGTEYACNLCEEKEIDLATAEGQAGTPDTPPGDNPENPRDDIPPDTVSPVE